MNHLKNEKSPYLLQHVQNPVDWYPWGTDAFDKAKREDRPIFLSIGYSTCHWCHVMAHESFEDREAAAVLNSYFVSIKVDREERPDIDSVYMSACQAVTGSGGWPLTVIMTPDQQPFFLGTYLPRHQRYGQPGLVELLQNIHLLWHQDRKKLTATGQQIAASISDSDRCSLSTPDKLILEKAVDLYRQQYDSQWGGFGHAPKFPAPHNLLFLLSYGFAAQHKEALKMAEHTLTAMARGGMNDQIGGGFSRYSTDEKWLAPHFEKMIYDNALLSISYLQAFQITGIELYAHTARRTLDYVLRELTGPDGEFYCGQDADSDGVEGKYYLFTRKEILDVLGAKDGEDFCRTYDITDGGNFEGSSIPNLIENDILPWPKDDLRLKKLYDYRQHRTSLHRDDKVIVSWNSWMMIAMAKAAQILGDNRYHEAAISAHLFIQKHLTNNHGRLYLRWREGEAVNDGQLDDYAVYGLALLELYRTTFRPEFLEKAVSVSSQMLQLFEDKKLGGYYLTACDAEVLIIRPKEVYDGAIPSGNSAAALLLCQLAQYTAESVWQNAVTRQMAFLAGAAQAYPVGHSFGLLALINILYPSAELVCISSDNRLPQELKEYLRKTFSLNLTVLFETAKNKSELVKTAPFLKDYPLPQEGVMYYLCKNGMCLAPEAEFTKLDM